MKYKNILSYKVYGKFALFTDPMTKLGGEKYSYPIPTYEAIKGISESVYWKPSFRWVVDRIRVMRPIRTQSKGIRPLNYLIPGNTLSVYTYLVDVEYQVQIHFEWVLSRKDLSGDWNEDKHFKIAQRMIERGGRRDVFLGTRECQGFVEPCEFGEGEGAYDSLSDMPFSLMFHGFTYPGDGDTADDQFVARFWQPHMKNGVIDFVRPEECPVKRVIRHYRSNDFEIGKNYSVENENEFLL